MQITNPFISIILAAAMPFVVRKAMDWILMDALRSAAHAWQVHFMRYLFYFGASVWPLDWMGVGIGYLLISMLVVTVMVVRTPAPTLAKTSVSWRKGLVPSGIASAAAVGGMVGPGSPDELLFDTEHNPVPDINPATGLPMLDGPGGIDVGGNAYGSDNSHWMASDHDDMSNFDRD